MNITGSYQISQTEFEEVFRIHIRYKFRMRRTMYLSVALLIFGVSMEHFFFMNFGWINRINAVLFVIIILFNFFCDFRWPKMAYQRYCEQEMDRHVITLQDNQMIIGDDWKSVKEYWSDFQDCIETEKAFLLYKKDMLYILWKQVCPDQVDRVRQLLQEKIKDGRSILFRK